jgi:RimJ/RimL family protein N-acetyltransferase
MQWLGGVGSIEETRLWLADRVAPHWEEHGYGLFALFEKDAPCAADGGRELVGRAGFHHCRIDGVNEVELQLAVAPAYQGRGYATEIGGALVGLALTSLDLESIIAHTLPHNTAFRSVLARLGFTYERDIVHEDQPHVLYRRARASDTEAEERE